MKITIWVEQSNTWAADKVQIVREYKDVLSAEGGLREQVEKYLATGIEERQGEETPESVDAVIGVGDEREHEHE